MSKDIRLKKQKPKLRIIKLLWYSCCPSTSQFKGTKQHQNKPTDDQRT